MTDIRRFVGFPISLAGWLDQGSALNRDAGACHQTRPRVNGAFEPKTASKAKNWRFEDHIRIGTIWAIIAEVT
jgi:hypothetical protein